MKTAYWSIQKGGENGEYFFNHQIVISITRLDVRILEYCLLSRHDQYVFSSEDV
jgi:hypothetical protein